MDRVELEHGDGYEGIRCAIDTLPLQRVVEVWKWQRHGVCTQGIDGVDVDRRLDHADLESVEILDSLYRVFAVMDVPEAQFRIRESDNPLGR